MIIGHLFDINELAQKKKRDETISLKLTANS